MEITPIGFLFLIIIVSILYNRKKLFENLFLLCLVTQLFVDIGFVAKIGETYIKYTGLIEFVLIIYCVLKIKKIDKRNNRKWRFLIFSYFVSILLLIVYPSSVFVTPPGTHWDYFYSGEIGLVHPRFNMGVVTMTIKFVLYSMIVLYAYSVCALKDYVRILSKMSKIINVFIILGIVEFFFKNFGGGNELWGNMLKIMFGIRDESMVAYYGRMRGGLYELNLFTTEASHYAYILFLVILLKFANNISINKKKKLDFPIIVSVVIALLSTSFSALLFLAGFAALYLVYRWGIIKPKSRKIEQIVFIGLIIVFSSSALISITKQAETEGAILFRLTNLFNNWDDYMAIDQQIDFHGEDPSSQVRLFSVLQSLNAFASRPLFGHSLSIISCHGAATMFLADVGIVGLILWIRFYFYGCPLVYDLLINKRAYIMGILIYILLNLTNSINLRPFYELTSIAYVICCCFIFSMDKLDKKKLSNSCSKVDVIKEIDEKNSILSERDSTHKW